MFPPSHTRRLSALVACTLAVTVAAGVATPRLRVAARERVVRSALSRIGSLREGAPELTATGLLQPDVALASAARDQREMPAVVPHSWRPVAAAAAAVGFASSPAPPYAVGPPRRPGRAPPLASPEPPRSS